MVQPLYCSAAGTALWGKRGYSGGSTTYAWLSSMSLFPWLPDFLPQAFPTTISSFIFTQDFSPQSTADLVLRLVHNPYIPALSHCLLEDLHPCLEYVWLWQGLSHSHSEVSNSLWLHGLQHSRPPCLSPTPGVYSNSCPLMAIQTSHPLSSPPSAFNLFQHQGLFKWVSSSHQVAKVLEFQLQNQSFQHPALVSFRMDSL